MTRVIAGLARGRRLAVPAGDATRPTADRVREALFSSLESALGSLAGADVLDLYAGTGAVGLEALSRGAAGAIFVESGAPVAAVLRRNVTAVGLPGAVVVELPVERAVARPAPRPHDVAFLDPPYATPTVAVADVVSALLAYGWLRPDAVVVVERASRDRGWAWPAGVDPLRSRRYGEATLWYGRAAQGMEQPAPHAS